LEEKMVFPAATFLVALTLAQPNLPPDQPPRPESDSVYFPPGLCLVQARTTQVAKGQPPEFRGTFVITHVYAGNDQLKGKAFECSTAHQQMGSRVGPDRDRRVSRLEEGTEGLWWLRAEGKDNTLRPELRAAVIDEYQLRPFPYQNSRLSTTDDLRPRDLAAEYKEGLEWANAVETIYRAKSDAERETLLRRLATTEAAPSAGWAIALLAKGNREGTTAFLERLVDNDKLSADSQVTLDQVLARIDGTVWRTSERRSRLLGRLLEAGAAKPRTFETGCKRLLDGLRAGDIDFALYAQVLDPALAKADRLTEENVSWLARTLHDSQFREEDRAKAFDWKVRSVGQARTPLLRVQAASGLQGFQRLTPDEVQTVRTLRQMTADPMVREALDVVLSRR
jgi:hypothetical protein